MEMSSKSWKINRSASPSIFFCTSVHTHKHFYGAWLIEVLAEIKFLLSIKSCNGEIFLICTIKYGFSTMVLNLWMPSTCSWASADSFHREQVR